MTNTEKNPKKSGEKSRSEKLIEELKEIFKDWGEIEDRKMEQSDVKTYEVRFVNRRRKKPE